MSKPPTWVSPETRSTGSFNFRGGKGRPVSSHPFHLSLGVRSLDASIAFFAGLLAAKVVHRDPSGYVNLDFYGTQVTLKQNADIAPALPDFHFGVNLTLAEFDELWKTVACTGRRFVEMEPAIWDSGTAIERKKMYLKCPSGYLVEIKGYA